MRLMPKLTSEADHQKLAVKYVEQLGFRGYLVMIPNGTQLPGGPQQRARYMSHLKAMGLLTGASDLFFAKPKGQYHGAWFEMKREEGSRTSMDQKNFLFAMEQEGYYTAVCQGFSEFKEAFDAYLHL